MLRSFYAAFSYLGAVALPAAFIMGFRYDANAPVDNVYFNLVLYAVFIAVHIIMTMPAFKRAVFGRPEGTISERQIFVTISVVTWVGVYALHKPVGGLSFVSPAWLQFIGICGVLLAVVAFFEFATFEGLASLLGLPGSELSHSVGTETPLMTQGSYAAIRHPMYRAACFEVFASLLIYPHMGQLLFAVLVAASFLGFVPFEERQLIKARGDEYREYMKRTPSRVFKGIW
jgi:protein-S-isoprenylcysteine O-methyltransferase Ste14